MLLQFTCPDCGSVLEAELAPSALEVACPVCNRTFDAADVLPPEQLAALSDLAPDTGGRRENRALEAADPPAPRASRQAGGGRRLASPSVERTVQPPGQSPACAASVAAGRPDATPEQSAASTEPAEETDGPLALGVLDSLEDDTAAVIDLEAPLPTEVSASELVEAPPAAEQPANETAVEEEAGAPAEPAPVPDVAEEPAVAAAAPAARPISGIWAKPPGEEVFGNYVLISQIGTSDVAVTYRARHLPTGQVVALKALIGGSPWASNEASRIIQHLQALPLAELEHPNLAHVFEVGEHEGVPYITTQYIEGRPFSAYLPAPGARQTAPTANISESELLSIIEAVAAGLAYAHRSGIIHGDIKPSNIIIDSYGNPVLVDFGFFRSPETVQKAGISDEVTARRCGYEFPYYAAPEQVDSGETFVESDIYSLGAVIYHFLAGRPPLTSDNLVRLCLKIRDEPPPPPRRLNPSISPPLQALVFKCLAKRPQERYHDCPALCADIHRLMVGEPVAAERAGGFRAAGRVLMRLAALLTLAAAGAAAYWAADGFAAARIQSAAAAPAALLEAAEVASAGDIAAAERVLVQALPALEQMPLEERRRWLPEVYYFIGRVRENAGDFAAARRCYERMAKFSSDPAALDGAGRACYMLGAYPEAADYFRRLLAVRPDASARVALALALWGAGRIDDAITALRTAGDAPQAQKYLKQLTAGRPGPPR